MVAELTPVQRWHAAIAEVEIEDACARLNLPWSECQSILSDHRKLGMSLLIETTWMVSMSVLATPEPGLFEGLSESSKVERCMELSSTLYVNMLRNMKRYTTLSSDPPPGDP